MNLNIASAFTFIILKTSEIEEKEKTHDSIKKRKNIKEMIFIYQKEYT